MTALRNLSIKICALAAFLQNLSAYQMKVRTLAAVLFTALLILLPSPCLAAPPQRFVIDDARIAPQEGTLYFSCSVSVDEEGGLHDLLKDGAVLELSVTVSLDRHRSWWANSETASVTYTSILRHDPLTRDFIVSHPDASGEHITRDRNLTRLLNGSWKRLSLPVTPMQVIEELGNDREYLLAATFSLRHTDVPPWLQNSVGFWSADVVPEQNLELEFFY